MRWFATAQVKPSRQGVKYSTFVFQDEKLRSVLYFRSMSLFIASLNSGSNGNCYYVGNNSAAVLIDAGISCREIEKRMTRLGLEISKVKAIFISHEHNDHIRGLTVLSKKFSIPVYITSSTLIHGGLQLESGQIRTFTSDKAVEIGGLVVTAFPKFHDASDPYSFTIEYNGIRAGVFTDIGYACPQVVKHFSTCHAAFLEANYDEEMLDKGSYPYHLKKRIRGGNGHLSNKQALDLFLRYRSSNLSHLLLSHLSAHNNCPDLVSRLFNLHCNNTKIIVAPRTGETPLFEITSSTSSRQVRYVKPSNVQLRLDFSI